MRIMFRSSTSTCKFTSRLIMVMTEHFMIHCPPPKVNLHFTETVSSVREIFIKYWRFVCISHHDMLYIANERENNLLCNKERQCTAALSRVIASYIPSKQQSLSALFRCQLCPTFGFTYLSICNSCNSLALTSQH